MDYTFTHCFWGGPMNIKWNTKAEIVNFYPFSNGSVIQKMFGTAKDHFNITGLWNESNAWSECVFGWHCPRTNWSLTQLWEASYGKKSTCSSSIHGIGGTVGDHLNRTVPYYYHTFSSFLFSSIKFKNRKCFKLNYYYQV